MNRRMEAETERFLLEHYEEFYRLAYGYVKTEQDALDVVQESAYKAIRDCGKIQNPEYLKTWICRIVINTSVDLLRKKKKEFPHALDQEPELADERDEFSSCEQIDVKELLDRLEEKEKAVIMLRYFHDMKLEEIAQVLGENVNTVKARLYRTLRKLRVVLEEE